MARRVPCVFIVVAAPLWVGHAQLGLPKSSVNMMSDQRDSNASPRNGIVLKLGRTQLFVSKTLGASSKGGKTILTLANWLTQPKDVMP